MRADLRIEMANLTESRIMGARKASGPKVLVLRCDECEKRATRHGYIKIDREAIAQRFQSVGDWEIIDTNSERIYWKYFIKPATPISAGLIIAYRLSCSALQKTYLKSHAYLLRNQAELMAARNWHGLIGRILADTEDYEGWLASPEPTEQNRARQQRASIRKRELDDNSDDPRHGILTGYQAGCKCTRC